MAHPGEDQKEREIHQLRNVHDVGQFINELMECRKEEMLNVIKRRFSADSGFNQGDRDQLNRHLISACIYKLEQTKQENRPLAGQKRRELIYLVIFKLSQGGFPAMQLFQEKLARETQANNNVAFEHYKHEYEAFVAEQWMTILERLHKIRTFDDALKIAREFEQCAPCLGLRTDQPNQNVITSWCMISLAKVARKLFSG